ncbi:hypothetical protein Tsubulata_014893 [Turnera subulata]|uniref:Kinesin-like protein n=1 Tax=Turnera subulata TaxID=218843 RepID=A0A9Q0G355_9ROSI|nr:hypothetical protein Tsubulata_014893 [Turnera subulata]
MGIQTGLSTTPRRPFKHNPDPTTNNFSGSKVRVIIRARPFLPHEIAATKATPTPCASVLTPDAVSSDGEVTVHLKDPDTSRNECYQLDSFFGLEDNNVSLIFEREVRPLIPGLFRGCNATVFAYGATGSGKTYTMQGTGDFPGLMPLAMSSILSECRSSGSAAEISYYEVYIEKCFDLLEEEAKEVVILDDKDGQMHLKGLSRVRVDSMSEFEEVLSRGIQRRKTAHTGLNDVSSRSHGVLVISVSTPCGDGFAVTGKLNLIDLAGNEDNRRTCNEGIRLLESGKINQSLFALSNVIYALNNNQTRVPYRESKLTRILQDSLGGTSRALMVACLNPGEYQESVRTVSLAARSRHIPNFVSPARKLETPKTKVDMEEKLRAWLESKGKRKSVQRTGANGPSSLASSVKKPNYYSSVKAKTNTNRGVSTNERTITAPIRILFRDEGLGDSCFQSLTLASEPNREEFSANFAEDALESATGMANAILDKEDQTVSVDINDSIATSLVAERRNMERSPLRKVLSPINPNLNRIVQEEEASNEHKCTLLSEPKTPSLRTCGNDKLAKVGTPLDKFNAASANLKNSLIQEYIDTLNTASREELQEIKGIGMKLAEYIVELRETSPLKSLGDLEKIGLSSKQAYYMFSRAARGIFDKQDGGATPNCAETSL